MSAAAPQTTRSSSPTPRPRSTRHPGLTLGRLKPSAVREALDTLELARIASVEEALQVLYYADHQLNIFALFADYFPDEYRRSRKSCSPPAERLARFRAEFGDHVLPHSPREEEFFELVDKKLFGFNYDLIDAVGRLDFIPLCGSYQDFYEYEPSGFLPALQLAGAVITGEVWTTVDEALSRHLGRPASVEPTLAQGVADSDVCHAVFSAEGEPLASFVTTLEIVDHSTGNEFVDHCCEHGGCMNYGWSRSSIEHLRREYDDARKIWDRMSAFDDWLCEDAGARFGRVVGLWNESVARSVERRRLAEAQKGRENRKGRTKKRGGGR